MTTVATEDIRALMTRYRERIEARDVAGTLEMYTEDIAFHVMGGSRLGGTLVGKAALTDYLTSSWSDVDGHETLKTTVFERYASPGRFTTLHRAYEPDGDFEAVYAFSYRIVGGLIAEIDMLLGRGTEAETTLIGDVRYIGVLGFRRPTTE